MDGHETLETQIPLDAVLYCQEKAEKRKTAIARVRPIRRKSKMKPEPKCARCHDRGFYAPTSQDPDLTVKCDCQKLRVEIIGDGAFGKFLGELLSNHILHTEHSYIKILAVPASSYDACGRYYGADPKSLLVNVCSIQKPTTDALLKYTDRVTSIHPLFGRRTPADKRNSILTHRCKVYDDTWYQDHTEAEFLKMFAKVSNIYDSITGIGGTEVKYTPETHDLLMAKTHASALMAAKQLKVFTDRVSGVPDHLIPNSFRQMREFVRTLDDMPAGTVESIMANPYI